MMNARAHPSRPRRASPCSLAYPCAPILSLDLLCARATDGLVGNDAAVASRSSPRGELHGCARGRQQHSRRRGASPRSHHVPPDCPEFAERPPVAVRPYPLSRLTLCSCDRWPRRHRRSPGPTCQQMASVRARWLCKRATAAIPPTGCETAPSTCPQRI